VLLTLLGFGSLISNAQIRTGPASFVVTHYDALLEPDIVHKSITGRLLITIKARSGNAKVLDLDCGDLTVENVREGNEALKFSQADHRLTVFLPRSAKRNQFRQIQIRYHGTPRRGIRFFPERSQVYTVFSTSHWMVCIDDPDQRATLHLRLMVPADQTTVGNGRFVARNAAADGKFIDEWQQDLPVPTYTFGFVAGRFRRVTEKRGATELHYLANEFSDEQVRRIFRDTADMIAFYEERAGIKYPGVNYTQVLAAGNVEQEMSGFTALREKYGSEVLVDERDVWLGAHELAHQWWGIMVGCRAWTHFWLNEGMASFMADAFKEHRFGREEYL
jgi:aminopeptidase N